MTENEAPTPCMFSAESFKSLISLTCFSGKLDLASPKIIFLEIYLLLYSELMSALPVKDNNQHAKRTGSLSSNVIKLDSIYTGWQTVSEFSRFG